MKYMIMLFGSDYSVLESKPKEWLQELVPFMTRVNQDLTASGELVDAQGLADGRQAKTIRIEDGLPVATDGPYAESKESLAGYWIVDVESEARAVEIASRVVAFTREPSEVRRVMDAPPEL